MTPHEWRRIAPAVSNGLFATPDARNSLRLSAAEGGGEAVTDIVADTIEKFAASCDAVRPEHTKPRWPDDSPVRWPESVRLDQITLPCGVHLLRFKWQGRLFVHSRWICDACNVESEQEIPWGGPSMPGIRAVLADVGRKMLDLQASKTARLEALGAEARALVEFAAASESEP